MRGLRSGRSLLTHAAERRQPRPRGTVLGQAGGQKAAVPVNVVVLGEKRSQRHVELEDEARLAFIRQDFSTALEQVRGALKYGSDCYRAQILHGDVLCALDQEVLALRAYHRARRLRPEKAEALWSISTVHFLSCRWRTALSYLDRAKLQLKRGDGHLYEWIAEDRALALLELGRPRQALEAVKWGLKRRPRGVRLRHIQAEVLAVLNGESREQVRPATR